jgi:hypothetical protein
VIDAHTPGDLLAEDDAEAGSFAGYAIERRDQPAAPFGRAGMFHLQSLII